MKRWRPPTRPLILIALLLLAGAVVNVAVAWRISLYALRSSAPLRRLERSDWAGPVPPTWPAPFSGSVRDGQGWSEVRQSCWESERSAPMAAHFEAGLPLRCLARTSYQEYLVEGYEIAHFVPGRAIDAEGRPARDPVRPLAWLGVEAELPCTPLFPGFLLNTLFYTAILALPLSASPIRRRLRARRGRCPKCGYDLAGLGGAEKGGEEAAPCTECGATR